MTSLLGLLYLKLMLQILGKSSRFGGIRVIQGCEGVGDFPGV